MQSFLSNQLAIPVIILTIITIALLAWMIFMHFRLRKFLVDVDSKNIADSLKFVSTGLVSLDQFRQEMESYLTSVEKRLRKSVQSVHTVRFNPFKGTGSGGNQSFATAFLNEEGDGVVISSLYSRDRVSVFSKSIKKYESEHELSSEEKEALENAKNRLR